MGVVQGDPTGSKEGGRLGGKAATVEGGAPETPSAAQGGAGSDLRAETGDLKLPPQKSLTCSPSPPRGVLPAAEGTAEETWAADKVTGAQEESRPHPPTAGGLRAGLRPLLRNDACQPAGPHRTTSSVRPNSASFTLAQTTEDQSHVGGPKQVYRRRRQMLQINAMLTIKQ